jgi:hypothetical protein
MDEILPVAFLTRRTLRPAVWLPPFDGVIFLVVALSIFAPTV